MSFLAAACEDGHYDAYSGGAIGDNITVDSTSGRFLPPNRCALTVNSTVQLVKNLPSPTAQFWIGARFYYGGGSFNGGPLIQVLGPSGRVVLSINANATANQFNVCKVSSSNSYTTLATTPNSVLSAAPSQPDKIDFYVDYSSSGSLAMYVNNVEVASYSGDVTFDDGVTDCVGVALGSAYNYPNVVTSWSSLLIETESTLGRDCFFRPPAANGDTQQWTGGYANVGNETVSSSVFDTTVNAGNTQLYKPTATIPTTYDIVRVVDVVQIAAGVAPNFNNLQFVRKIGGTAYNSADQSIPSTVSDLIYSWEVNPATGVAWAVSDVNDSGYQFGYESET